MEWRNGSNQLLKSMGKVLSKLRADSGHSREVVAEKVGHTASWLSMLEAGKAATTVKSLMSLLSVYGYSPSSFFELVEEETRDTSVLDGNVAVTREAEWQEFEALEGMVYLMPPSKGKLRGGRMDVTPVVLKSGHRSGVVLHSGEEVLYVLKGKIKLRFYYKSAERTNVIGEEELRQGDAIQFFASIRHEAENEQDQDAKYLVVRCPKRFP